MMRISKKASWASGVLLLLYAGCKELAVNSHTSDRREAGRAAIERTTHYLSGQVVLLERKAELLRVREAVALHRPEVKTLRLTASTIVVKGDNSSTISQIKRGDYVLIRYSVEPDGSSNVDEIRLVSKPESPAAPTLGSER